MGQPHPPSGIQGNFRPIRYAATKSSHVRRVHKRNDGGEMVSTRLAKDPRLPPSSPLTLYIVFSLVEIIAKPETKKSLPLALLRCLRSPFLDAVLPRLMLIVFRYSQPILINQSIKYATANHDAQESYRGHWLVIMAVAIYVGIAVGPGIALFLPHANVLFPDIDGPVPESSQQIEADDQERLGRSHS